MRCFIKRLLHPYISAFLYFLIKRHCTLSSSVLLLLYFISTSVLLFVPRVLWFCLSWFPLISVLMKKTLLEKASINYSCSGLCFLWHRRPPRFIVHRNTACSSFRSYKIQPFQIKHMGFVLYSSVVTNHVIPDFDK